MSLEEILADLKKEYLAGLPNRIENIRQHFLNDSDAATLQEDFHKMKGTGMTYGIPELSQLAEVGEAICRDRQQHIPTALPILLDLVAAIHVTRNRQQTFDLTADPRFSDLSSLR